MPEDRGAGDHQGHIIGSNEGFDVIECETCGHRHLLPLPTDAEIEAFYRDAFYQNERANYLKEADEDYAWKRVELFRRYAKAEDLLGKKHGVALDIGCGPGDFLAVGQERGWKVKGIEPSSVAAEHARTRGLDVDGGFFGPEVAKALGQFDLVHLSEVLEHVKRPKEILQAVVSCLKPGGILCVSSPNDFNGFQEVVARLYDRPKWWILPHHHLNYFDFDSLERLFVGQGLEPVFRTTNFPMELFLLMGQNYVGDHKAGRALHGRRKKFDLSLFEAEPELLEKFYSSLAGAALGRLALVFARKPQ